MKDWINQTYAQVCVETEANQTYATMALTANTATYTLPSAVLRIKEMFVTPVNGVQSSPLIQTNLDDILRLRTASGGTATATGSATHFALLGLSQLEVYPTPTAADVVTIYYVVLPTALSADADVPILQEPYGSKILAYGAMAEAADFKEHPNMMVYRSVYEDWLKRYRSHLARRLGSQTTQFAVADGPIYPPHDPSTDIRSVG